MTLFPTFNTIVLTPGAEQVLDIGWDGFVGCVKRDRLYACCSVYEKVPSCDESDYYPVLALLLKTTI